MNTQHSEKDEKSSQEDLSALNRLLYDMSWLIETEAKNRRAADEKFKLRKPYDCEEIPSIKYKYKFLPVLQSIDRELLRKSSSNGINQALDELLWIEDVLSACARTIDFNLDIRDFVKTLKRKFANKATSIRKPLKSRNVIKPEIISHCNSIMCELETNRVIKDTAYFENLAANQKKLARQDFSSAVSQKILTQNQREETEDEAEIFGVLDKPFAEDLIAVLKKGNAYGTELLDIMIRKAQARKNLEKLEEDREIEESAVAEINIYSVLLDADKLFQKERCLHFATYEYLKQYQEKRGGGSPRKYLKALFTVLMVEFYERHSKSSGMEILTDKSSPALRSASGEKLTEKVTCFEGPLTEMFVTFSKVSNFVETLTYTSASLGYYNQFLEQRRRSNHQLNVTKSLQQSTAAKDFQDIIYYLNSIR